jgi:hypothetical protein
MSQVGIGKKYQMWGLEKKHCSHTASAVVGWKARSMFDEMREAALANNYDVWEGKFGRSHVQVTEDGNEFWKRFVFVYAITSFYLSR